MMAKIKPYCSDHESASGTTLTSTTGQIVTNVGDLWTLTDGGSNGLQANRNDAPAGFTMNILSLLYYEQGVYQENINHDWWEWRNGGWETSSDPRGETPPEPQPEPPATGVFYSLNGHITWNWENPSTAAYEPDRWQTNCNDLNDIGATVYRNGFSVWYNDQGGIHGSDVDNFRTFHDNHGAAAGITLHPVVLCDYERNGSEEQAAYDVGYAVGVEVAKLRDIVPHIEINNEIDAYAINGSGVNGTRDDHYDNHRFCVARGVLFGTIDGIKSVDPSIKIASPGGTWLHTAFFDMLRDGRQPDGSSGRRKMDWDITCWHWYRNNYGPNDNPENSEGGFNLLAHIAGWGKPIHLNEFGANWPPYNGDEEAVGNAIVEEFQQFYDVREKYRIENISYYQLYDAAGGGTPPEGNEMNFGVIHNDGDTKKSRFYKIQDFIKNHLA